MVDRHRPPGMKQVAILAGVSHQTVSRVLNGSAQVRPQTADRVRRAIDELGYRPNRAARALASSRSGLIGVIAAGFPHLGPASTVGAIETAARAAGYATMVAVLGDESLDDVGDALESFAGYGVQGIVAVAPYPALADGVRAAADAVPTVLIGDLADDPGAEPFSRVAIDQREGARSATEYLLGRGLHDLVHLSGPSDWYDAAARVRGFGDALDDAGPGRGRVLEGDWSAATGRELGRELIRTGIPDAIVCANDHTAFGVLAALREAGLAVPGDVSVVGFDDLPAAEFLDPPLTTVHQPFDDLGRRAVAALLDLLDGEPPAQHVLAPALIVRGSTR